MIYAVIDTNVLVSALITHHPDAATAKVVRLLLEKTFVPIFNADIIAEYGDVLHRPKFPIQREVADSLIAHIIENGVEASRVNSMESMPDEDDRVFYEVSLSMDESFLVTGNLKHYPNSPRVISPSDFVNVLCGELIDTGK
ncbi:MAG: putative toxin-antitoxin system toxin component, PIN family [Bacteroidaceae bacterium]|nr:putative toxin-antitoxin system toxin component, PIN family [Bacteroidaceae bacterium]